MKRKSVILLFVFSGAYAHWGNSVEMEAIKICVTSKNYITDICQTLTFPALWNNYCSKHVISSSDINKEKKCIFLIESQCFITFPKAKTIMQPHYYSANFFLSHYDKSICSKDVYPATQRDFFSNHIIKSCQLLNYLI